jgi:hypothetical protein
MTIREIIARIINLYEKGVPSRNVRLSPRHVYNKIVTVRSKLISQEAKKRQKINQWNYQTLPCVELIKVDAHECPCIAPVGCEILRSKFPIPKPLTNLNSHLIQSVTTIDGNTVFNETTFQDKKYKAGSKYSSNKPDYYFRNNYLYVTHKSGLKVITITALFDNPLDVIKFESYCKENCVDCKEDCDSILDNEFPIDNDMIDTLVDLSKIELIEQFIQMKEDITNNSSDSIPEISK